MTQKLEPEEVVRDLVLRAVPSQGEGVYVGIDPGADGAIALLCGESYCVVDVPTLTTERKAIKMLSQEERAVVSAHRFRRRR